MKRFLLLALTCSCAFASLAQDGTAELNWRNEDIGRVVIYYGDLVKKPVFQSIDLSGQVTLRHFGLKQELPEVIRQTLSKMQITLRETKDGEILAESLPVRKPLARPPKSPDEESFVQCIKADVISLLELYWMQVQKPIFIAPNVSALVTIYCKGARKEIPELIRKTVLEKYGIAIRETGDGEVLVEWSKDPAFPRRSEPPDTAAERAARTRVYPVRPLKPAAPPANP